MSPSDLLCLTCGAPAFAVINVEIGAGRARWPTCAKLDCTGRALQDAGVRLANAANQHTIARVIDVEERAPIKITGAIDASEQFINSLPVIYITGADDDA